MGGESRGFTVAERLAPRRLVLTGSHWFSRYELAFALDETAAERTRITAESRAEFPGIAGRIYRALVIGSGGHVLVVRALLRRIAAAAERGGR